MLNRVHDLGGHDVARELWAEYFTAVNAIVYLVDCNDRDRFPEAKAELDKLLSNDQLQGVPFLILGNKIDMQRAASEPELRQALGLQHYLTGKVGFCVQFDLCANIVRIYFLLHLGINYLDRVCFRLLTFIACKFRCVCEKCPCFDIFP